MRIRLSLTVQDLQQCLNDADLSKRTNIPHNVLCQLQQDISYEVSTCLQKSAADLWEQEQCSSVDLALSTGNVLLDQTLSSKLASDNITEIYGLDTIEKLEICLNMLLSAEETNREIMVYYVDMGNRFDAYQLQHLYLSSKYHTYRERGITLQHVLSRIHCVQCRTFSSLLLFLEKITSQLDRLSKRNPQSLLVFLDGWDLLELPLDFTQVTYYVSLTMHYLRLSKTDDSSLLLLFHDVGEFHQGQLYPINLASHQFANVGLSWCHIADKQMIVYGRQNHRGHQAKLIKAKIRR